MLKNYNFKESKENEFPNWFRDSLLLFKRVGLNQILLLTFVFLINSFSSMLLFDGQYPWYWILWLAFVSFISYPMLFFIGEQGANGKKIGFEDSWKVFKKFYKTKSIMAFLGLFIFYVLAVKIDLLFSIDLAGSNFENGVIQALLGRFNLFYQKNISLTIYFFFLLVVLFQTFSFVFFMLTLQSDSKKISLFNFVFLVIEISHRNVSFLILSIIVNPLSTLLMPIILLVFCFMNFYVFMLLNIVWFVLFINFNLIVFRDVFENKKGLNPLEQDVKQKEKSIVPNF